MNNVLQKSINMHDVNLKAELLSVVCTCYNHEKYIEDCIKSIWNNDYKNVEIIVIDDGSTDNSVEVLRKLQAKSPCPFKIITQKNTHNIGKNVNRAIKKASGEFIAFISTDDYYTNNAFSTKLKLMLQDNKIAFIVSRRVNVLYEDGNIKLADAVGERFNSDTSIKEMCEIEYREGTFATQGNIFRREILDAVNGYDEDIHGDDIVIRTKILQYMAKNPKWKFKVIDTPAFVYRLHENGLHNNELAILNIFLDCYDRYWSNRPYTLDIENKIYNYIAGHKFKEKFFIFVKHPRVIKSYAGRRLMKLLINLNPNKNKRKELREKYHVK